MDWRQEFTQGSKVGTSACLNVSSREHVMSLVDMAFECLDPIQQETVDETRDDPIAEMRLMGQNGLETVLRKPYQNADFRNMVDNAFRLVAEQQRELAESARVTSVQQRLPDAVPLLPSGPLLFGMPMFPQPLFPNPIVLPQGPLNGDRVEDFAPPRPSAFITYISSPSHFPTILEIANSLSNSGIDVRLDAFERSLIAQCRTNWYRKCIEESDFVIVCVDILYKYQVEQCQLFDIQTEEDQSFADAIFVHNLLQTKYVNNGCSNFNILPLIIDNAPFSALPLWLQNTRVYHWPVDQDKLTMRMQRR